MLVNTLNCIRRTPISTRDADPDPGRAHCPARRRHRHPCRIGPASADRCALVTEAATQPVILRAARTATDFERGIKAEARTVLLRSIMPVRRWRDEVLGGSTLDEIAVREGCTTRHVAKTIPLAFLAPDLVQALIEARLPRGFSTKRIGAPELEWARQWELGVRR